MAERYRLKADTPELRAGAIFENNNNSSDGSQRFTCVNLAEVSYLGRGKCHYIIRRTLENAPEWFEKIYTVNDIELTKDEFDRLVSLAKGGAKTIVP